MTTEKVLSLAHDIVRSTVVANPNALGIQICQSDELLLQVYLLLASGAPVCCVWVGVPDFGICYRVLQLCALVSAGCDESQLLSLVYVLGTAQSCSCLLHFRLLLQSCC